jgi:hypothetical protein
MNGPPHTRARARMHTHTHTQIYIYSMDPKVCHNDSMMWNKWYTYKIYCIRTIQMSYAELGLEIIIKIRHSTQ